MNSDILEQQVIFHDRDIARVLGYSLAWVRGQRMKRKKGEPHVLAIDSVEIGGRPRYRAEDFRKWLGDFMESLGEPSASSEDDPRLEAGLSFHTVQEDHLGR